MNIISNYKLNSPYKGLVPYTESDRLMFFGRDTDQETILRNLITWRLTILYGASGVGKSSILRAGVAHYLHQTAQDNVNVVGKPGWAVIVFPYFPEEEELGERNLGWDFWFSIIKTTLNKEFEVLKLILTTLFFVHPEELDKKFLWQNPLTGIKEKLKKEMKNLGVKDEEFPQEDISLVETLKEWVKIIGTEEECGRLFIILDQFEEYFVARSEFASSSPGDKNKLLRNFDQEFSEAVNDIDLNVNFLISIREESLSKIDYFQGQIKSDLLKKRLQLKPLNPKSARKAIEQPMAQYNRQAIILESLQNSRLTFIYGDSDTHKTTLLSGIVQYIENNLDKKEQKLAFTPSPFNKWDTIDSSPLKFIKQKIEAEEENSKLFFLFDQLENYLFTEPEKACELLQGLPSLMKEFPNTNFLICFDNSWLSESEKNQLLSRFAFFNNQIPDCPKYLHLFNSKQGIYRIEEEIVNLNHIKPVERFKFNIEPELIDEVLEGVKIEREAKCVESSTLQLVMNHLWQEEIQNLSVVILALFLLIKSRLHRLGLLLLKNYRYTLRAETLRKFARKNLAVVIFAISFLIQNRLHQLGLLLLKNYTYSLRLAVKNIVREDVYKNLKNKELSQEQLETSSRLLYYLITPSGIRWAQTVKDLIDYANNSRFINESELTPQQTQPLLDKLSEGDFPILRPSLGNRYEIFRPVLSEAILNWVQLDRQIKHLEEKAKDALQEFKSSQLQSLVKAMKIGKKLAEIKNKDQSLFTELLGGVPPIINLALQKILDNIREKNHFSIKPRSSSYYGFCVSRDGQKLASGSLDGKVSLLNLQGNLLEKPFPVSSGPVYCVSFSPDSQQLVTTSWKPNAYLWNLKGEKINTVPPEEKYDTVYFATFSPDSQQLVTTSENGIAYLWDLQQPDKAVRKFPDQGGPVYYASFSPDWRKLATIAWIQNEARSIIYLWDVDSAKRQILPSPARQVYRVKFSPDGKLLIIASFEGKAYLHDLEVPDKKPIEFPHKGPVYFADFKKSLFIDFKKSSFNIRLWTLLLNLDALAGMLFWQECLAWEVVTASWDGTIRFWDLKGEERAKLMINKEPAYRASLSLNGQQFTNITWDGVAHLWDLGECASNLKDKSLKIGSCKHKAVVFRISFSPDGKYLCTASADGIVRLWDLQQKEKPQLLKDFSVEKKPKPIYYVSFSPDGNYLAIASDNQEILLYDLGDLDKPWKTLKGHKKRVYSVSFSSDGKYLASASEDNKVLLWDWQQDKKIIEPVSLKFKEHKGSVYYACFSPNGQYLASASADGTSHLLDMQQPNLGKLIKEFKGHFGFVYCVNFSPDGEKLATASQDGTVRLWNLQGEELGQCIGHEAAVFWVTFSPDGEKLATASQDGTVRLWKLQENLQGKLQGEPIAIFKDHEDKQPIYCAIFSPDGKWLATASGDCTVKIRQLEDVEDLEKILFRGCHWLRDYLETDLKTDPDPDINKDKKELAVLCGGTQAVRITHV